jgi:RimJ/RimL family protein N-acetyltransferase
MESERLLLRPFTLQDSDFIVQLLNSAGWIKYIGDRHIKTTQQARDYLQNGPLKSYQTLGFGLSLVALKATGTPIGMCGLIKRDYLAYLDIGFAFLPDYMGRGYAYEIAEKAVAYGFRHLQQEKILAITLPDNRSSIKLLERLGFRYEQDFISKDTNEVLGLYAIHQEDFGVKNGSGYGQP